MPASWRMTHANQGFDQAANPDWLMVAEKGSKTIELRDGQNMVVTADDATVIEVRELLSAASQAIRSITIRGKKKGSTFVRVRQGATLKLSLEVCVKGIKNVKVSFNFVSDKAGHKTTRNTSLVDAWVKTMNTIYVPQTNIYVKKQSSRSVKVNRDLGTVVRYSSHLAGVAAGQHEWGHVVAKRDTSADFNFFFVWAYEQDNTPATDNTDAGAKNGNCLFEDAAGTEVAETMAHELGHHLGVKDFYTGATRDWLMYGITDTRGRHITKAHANKMNP